MNMKDRVKKFSNDHPIVEKAIVVAGAVGGFVALSVLNGHREQIKLENDILKIDKKRHQMFGVREAADWEMHCEEKKLEQLRLNDEHDWKISLMLDSRDSGASAKAKK